MATYEPHLRHFRYPDLTPGPSDIRTSPPAPLLEERGAVLTIFSHGQPSFSSRRRRWRMRS